MGHTRKIAVFTSHRSERGILEPVIRRLEQLDADRKVNFELVQVTLTGEGDDAMFEMTGFSKEDRPEVALIPADRKEMVFVAWKMRWWQIPMFHLWAGVGHTGTEDDMNRRIISSLAYLMLVEDDSCKRRLIRSGEEPWRCITVGSTHFDDLKIDESLVPKEPYDLVLVKPNPAQLEEEPEAWRKVFELADKRMVQVGSAEGTTTIHGGLNFGPQIDYYAHVERPKFLGLLKNCSRFISNSSSAAYEAPYFGVKVVNPGKRNAQRKSSFVREPGAADKIVDILQNYPIDKSKLLKRYP